MKNFQVNLEGIIDLLSSSLYSSKNVFVRELLQNAVDAITARQLTEEKFLPRVEVSYISDEEEPTIIFDDNGIGLNEDEVINFLTQIGASSKRGEDVDRSSFIGQFGIGLLSCFMVTDKIVMTTQSIKADYALRWTGEADGTYHYERIDKKEEPGTTVYIKLKEQDAYQFTAYSVAELLKQYGGLLPYPIRFNDDLDSPITLNYESNPLGKTFSDHTTEQQQLLEFGLEQFGQHFLAAIPLTMPSGETQGVAYVRPVSHVSDQLEDKVFLKGMLVSEKVDNILPRWAFFLKAVINTTKLQPTASRERFYQNEELEFTRKRIGKLIRNQLMRWSEEQPILLKKVIEVHQRAIKEMAEEDSDFLKIVWPYLRFPTTKGQLTLPEVRKNNPVIKYIYELEVYQQIRSFAGAHDITIIKTRYGNDMTLLRLIERIHPDWTIEELDIQDLFEELEELTKEEKAYVHEFDKKTQSILQEFGCEITIRKFEPDQVPTICYLEPNARMDRTADYDSANLPDLWKDIMKMVHSTSVSKQATLCLNFNNPSIQRLINVQDDRLLNLNIRFLYFQALLLGNYTLSQKEMALFSQSITEMIDLYEPDQKPFPFL